MEKTHPILPLVILDVQDAIDQPVWAGKNNPDYVNVIQRLLKHWRAQGWPVIFIKHDEAVPTSSYHTHGPWNEIKKDVAPIAGEIIITKEQNCAFTGTRFDRVLKGLNAEQFVLTGVVIHNSMDATIRTGKALGYHILLPMDATTAIPVKGHSGKLWSAETVFDVTFGILGGEYVQVTTSAEVMKRPG